MGASTPAGRKASSSSFTSFSEYRRAFAQTHKRFWNRALAVTTPSEEMTEVLLFLHTSFPLPTKYLAEAATLTAFIPWSLPFKLNSLEGHYFYSEHLLVSSLNPHVLDFNELIRTGPFLFLFFLLVMFVSGHQLAGGRILRGSQL